MINLTRGVIGMKAIQVRFLPATDFKGARIKAFVEGGGSVTVPYQYELSEDEGRVSEVAQELIYKMQWNVEISGIGQLPNGDYAITIKSKNN